MIDNFRVGEILKGLIENTNEMEVLKINYDDGDGSVSVSVKDNGKIRRFLIEVKEV